MAKFSSDFYIHIYAQHIFHNAINKIYLVLITQKADLFFQIALAYQKMKIRYIPLKYYSLQNLCNLAIILYNLDKYLLPKMLFQNCKEMEKILFFFKCMEWFNKKGWSLRHEPSKLHYSGNWYSKLPKNIHSETGLIHHFPRIRSQRIFRLNIG